MAKEKFSRTKARATKTLHAVIKMLGQASVTNYSTSN